MAGILRDGFDSFNSAAAPVGIYAKWTGAGCTLVSGRFGGQAVRAAGGAGTQSLEKSLDSAVSSLTIHGGLRINSYAAATPRPPIKLRNGATFHFGIAFETGGVITAYRQTSGSAGTSLGSSAAGVVTTGVWYTFEAEIVISDTVGRVTIYIDGAQVLNLTSQDTRNGATSTVDVLDLGNAGTTNYGSTDFDDLYVTDSATKLTDAVRIETLYPTSDGATLNLVPSTGTDHYAVVDETLASASDYLSGTTVGDLDLLGLGNLATTPSGIEEVNIVGYLAKTDATARSMALGVKSGSTTSDGANFALNSTGLRHDRPLATDPDTSAAWTASGVNALQLQPKVTV